MTMILVVLASTIIIVVEGYLLENVNNNKINFGLLTLFIFLLCLINYLINKSYY